MTIVLLDIDGTLIRTGRAGSRAMNRAFEDLFGIAGAFDGVAMAGRTDRWILDDAAARAGVDLGGDNFHRFRERYFVRLTDALREPAPGKGVLPGVRRLLESLDTRDDVFCALLTGNCEEARASSSSTSTSGNFFAAARTATTSPIATICSTSPWTAPMRAACRACNPAKSSSSATRCWTWRARRPRARGRWRSRPVRPISTRFESRVRMLW